MTAPYSSLLMGSIADCSACWGDGLGLWRREVEPLRGEKLNSACLGWSAAERLTGDTIDCSPVELLRGCEAEC